MNIRLVDANGNRIPQLYMISGSELVQFNNRDFAAVHTWTFIKNKFNEKYGFIPSSPQELGVTYFNGDSLSNGYALIGVNFDSETFFAMSTNSFNGKMRINYSYFYYF